MKVNMTHLLFDEQV